MCGITGVISTDNINEILYESLFQIQHRGINSCGFVVENNGFFNIIHKRGLLRDSIKNINWLDGQIGLGHVKSLSEHQHYINRLPSISQSRNIAICIDGYISNYNKISKRGLLLKTVSDSELMLALIEKFIGKAKILSPLVLVNAIKKISDCCKGNFSAIMMIKGFGLVAFKDKFGTLPLIYGKKNTSYIISSESVSITKNNFSLVRDISAGEVVIFNEFGPKSYQYENLRPKPSIIEWICKSRQDSLIDGISVYKSHINLGKKLGKTIMLKINTMNIDLVASLSENSKAIALGVSEIIKKPYRECIRKNLYVSDLGEGALENNIARQYNIVKDQITNKNILVIDNILFTGDTIKDISKILRDYGANKIYIGIASSPVKYNNTGIIDMVSEECLLINNIELGQINEYLGVNNIVFQKIGDMTSAVKFLQQFELSIFDRKYGDTGKYLNKKYYSDNSL